MRSLPRQLAANGEAEWALCVREGARPGLGAEGVGQALWKGTPERGCEQSGSREAPRLRGSASGVTDSGGPAESEKANAIP